MKLSRVFFLGLGAVLLWEISLGVRAQPAPGQSGVIHFNSVNVSGYGALVRKRYDTQPVQIFGTLLLPADLSARVPAMVIKHGSGGVSEKREFEWAQVLNDMGIAAFIVDSFTPRGITSTATDQSVLSAATDIADALNALKLLASHPDIDPSRIGIIGFSRGGSVTSQTAYEEIRKGVIDDELRFAAHIPVYPSCTNRFWSPNMTGAPLLYLLAALDDYTPALPCADFTPRLATLGADITTIIYPDAHHGFDGGLVTDEPRSPARCENCTTSRNCALETRLDTFESSRFDTGEVFASNEALNAYLASCTTTGVTTGWNAAAESMAINDVRIFLTRVFNLSGVTLPASQADRIFNWLQDAFPQYLQPRGTQSQTGYGYYFRCYGGTGSCVGARDGKIYYLVPAIDPNTIFELGDEAGLLGIAVQSGY